MYLRLFEDNPNSRDIQKVVSVLKQGGVIIYPTDTVYALGCDIMQHKAVQRVAQLKGVKPEQANFSIICEGLSDIAAYAKVTNNIFKLMKRALPGPYTFILPATGKLPKILENKRKNIGVRVPQNFIIHDIVEALGNPILTTSIRNDDDVIEYITDPELIYEKYKNQVDIVIDGGYGQNEASTIVDCTGDDIEIVREGIGSTDIF
ncbi:MAG: L-threonylcarbamoyladenylate synthase [Marinifilaceae bacterium]